MPKVKWLNTDQYKTPADVPPPNMLKELFGRHRRTKKISYAELAEKLGLKEQSVRSRFSRGVWDSREIREWCEALEISDPAEVGRALLYK